MKTHFTYTIFVLFMSFLLCNETFLLSAQSNKKRLEYDILPNEIPDDDSCYSRAVMPDRYEIVKEQVVVREAYTETIDIPPVYETIEEIVLVKEQSVELIVIPAVYKTVYEKVLVKEAAPIINEKYETVTEQVLVKPEEKEWVRMKNANCFSDNPEDCYYMRWVVTPAQYETQSRRVLTGIGGQSGGELPARYETVPREILVQAETVREVIVPAVYDTVAKQVLRQPARNEQIRMPAEYATVEIRQLVEAGGRAKWTAIPCPEQITSILIKQMQIALQSKGYYINGLVDGIVGPLTKEALKNYQRRAGLPMGNLNKETLISLGLTY